MPKTKTKSIKQALALYRRKTKDRIRKEQLQAIIHILREVAFLKGCLVHYSEKDEFIKTQVSHLNAAKERLKKEFGLDGIDAAELDKHLQVYAEKVSL